jgi:hypothetical protein
LNRSRTSYFKVTYPLKTVALVCHARRCSAALRIALLRRFAFIHRAAETAVVKTRQPVVTRLTEALQVITPVRAALCDRPHVINHGGEPLLTVPADRFPAKLPQADARPIGTVTALQTTRAVIGQAVGLKAAGFLCHYLLHPDCYDTQGQEHQEA